MIDRNPLNRSSPSSGDKYRSFSRSPQDQRHKSVSYHPNVRVVRSTSLDSSLSLNTAYDTDDEDIKDFFHMLAEEDAMRTSSTSSHA